MDDIKFRYRYWREVERCDRFVSSFMAVLGHIRFGPLQGR